MSSRTVGKIIIIILSFWVGTSKNKTIDHRVKKLKLNSLAQKFFVRPYEYELDSFILFLKEKFRICELRKYYLRSYELS